MPTLTIGDKKVQVGDDFMKLSPEQQNSTVEEISRSLPSVGSSQDAGPSSAEQPSLLKQFGKGMVRGAEGFVGDIGAGLVGLPKSIASLATGHLHRDRPELEYGADLARATGMERQPGESHVIGTLGEIAGNPLSAVGGGSAALKAGTGIASALGSEAGRATGIPGAELVGSLVGGGAAGAAAAERGSARLGAQLPTHAQIKTNADAAYKAIENSRLEAKTPAVTALTTDIRAHLDNALVSDQGEAGVVFKAVDKMNGGIADIMDLYSRIGKIPPSEGTKFTAAQIARDRIQEWMGKLTAADVVTGDPQFTQAMWDHARLDWLKHKKLEMLEEATTKAQRQASATGTGANRINKARQAIEKILDSEKKSRGMSPEARQKMIEIVEGTYLTNKARNLSKFAPTGPVSLLGPLLTGEVVGGSAGVGLAAAGYTAKHLGEYLTDRQIRQLDELIRSESNAGQSILAQQAPQRAELKTLAPAGAIRGALTSPLAPGQ